MKSIIHAFSPDGFKVDFEIDVENVADLAIHLHALKGSNYSPYPVDPNSADKEATITTVIRREYQKAGKKKRVIDCYPDRYKWRFVTIYLDDDAKAISEFERYSGLKLSALPVLNSQTALERDAAYRNDCEVECNFGVRKVAKTKTNEAGEVETVFNFAGYTGMPVYSEERKTDFTTQPSTPLEKAVNIRSLTIVHKDSNHYVQAGDIFLFTRQPFRDAGYDADKWSKPGTVNLNTPCAIYWKLDEKGFKVGVKVEMERRIG